MELGWFDRIPGSNYSVTLNTSPNIDRQFVFVATHGDFMGISRAYISISVLSKGCLIRKYYLVEKVDVKNGIYRYY